jgi:hypothetical protein
MRIQDIILDVIIGTRLFEMAFKRKNAIDKVRAYQSTLISHLIKILIFEKSENRNHWCNEVNSYLDSIQDIKLKGTNQPLESSMLFELMFNEPIGHLSTVDKMIIRIQRQYQSDNPSELNGYKIHKQIHDILYDISHDISLDRFNDIREYL